MGEDSAVDFEEAEEESASSDEAEEDTEAELSSSSWGEVKDEEMGEELSSSGRNDPASPLQLTSSSSLHLSRHQPQLSLTVSKWSSTIVGHQNLSESSSDLSKS